jgi:hypothetical protein
VLLGPIRVTRTGADSFEYQCTKCSEVIWRTFDDDGHDKRTKIAYRTILSHLKRCRPSRADRATRAPGE